MASLPASRPTMLDRSVTMPTVSTTDLGVAAGQGALLSHSSSFSNSSTPIATSSTLNRPATSSASLYQKCLLISERLYRVEGFAENFLDEGAPFSPSDDDISIPTDPVSQVCHCLRLGSSLCFLFNALELQSAKQLDINPNANRSNLSACKKSAAHFLMAAKRELDWTDDDLFTITQLYDQDTTGTVKVCTDQLCSAKDIKITLHSA